MHSILKQFHDSRRAVAQSRVRDGLARVRNGRVPKGQEGLTLVEMIVVLAIIALVAALIVPNVIGRPDEARVTVANTDIRTISAALKMYRLDNGQYPTTQQGLRALVERPTTPPVPRNWSGEGYLSDIPTDPWGNPYSYTSPAPGGFDLKSFGADGRPGGEGLDADLTGKTQ
jgi:general secretion pathway protein G